MNQSVQSEINLAESVERDATDLLYSNSLAGILVSLVAISALVFGMGGDQNKSLKILLWFGMTGVLCARLIDYVIWKLKLEMTEYNAYTANLRFTTGCLLTALLWGTYGIIIFDTTSQSEFTAAIIVICAMAGGSASILAANRIVSIAYTTLLLAPMSLYALTSEDQIKQGLAILGLVFNLVMIFTNIKSSQFTYHAIKLKNDNAALVDMMEQERSEVQRVNNELTQANASLDKNNLTLEEMVQARTEELYRITSVDPLTGLLSRAAFSQHLKDLAEQSIEHNSVFALLFLDLDGFKTINDTLGHKVGDQVLIEMADRLKMFGQEKHAGRWGGDEYLITLPYADKESALSVARAIQTSLQQTVSVQSNELTVEVSIAIAMFPEHTTDTLELVQMADVTMNAQKQSSETQPRIFTQDLYASRIAQQKIKDGLQNAIVNKQLHLVYQPIIDSDSGQVWSFEALLRWNFDGSPVFPDVFIPLAEESGLIREIGAWVLHRACIDASQWFFASSAAVSVNVSVNQLMDDNFLSILDSALTTSGLAPDRLHLELTESVFAENKERIKKQISAIKARGIQISIDDFGTGYSSLSQLQNLNFDHIKIDRSFVSELSTGKSTIIKATLTIAHELGCSTVAEGIEDEETSDLLKSMGIDSLQGYWFSRPIPNDDLSKWHQQNITEGGFSKIRLA